MSDDNDGDGRRRGRPKKGEIQIRRFTALRELLQEEETWLPVLEKAQLGEFEDAAEIEREIDELYVQMFVDASDRGARPPERSIRDAVADNPEAHLLHALRTARWLRGVKKKIGRIDDRLRRIHDALDEGERDARLWIVEALAQRPTVDREVLRRARQMETAGVTRKSVGQLKNDAERAWRNPADWSDLERRIGPILLIEKAPNPQQVEILDEALPPFRRLESYGLDRAMINNLISNSSSDRAFETIVDLLGSWMNLYSPRRSSREAKTIARGWTVLLLKDGFDFGAMTRFPTIFLPSPWSPERIVEISRE